MIETDFGWALAKMRDGYKVRRKEWPPGSFWTMPEDHSAIRTHTGLAIVYVSPESVLAYDWELAE
jgi:hypothetical protein